jgi:hypothetical protein
MSDSPDTIEPVAETSIEDDIRAAIAEHSAADDKPVDEPVAEPEPEAVDETPTERPRGPDGKFAAKEAAEPEAAPVPPPAPVDEPIITDPFALAPQYAKKAVKENWDKLPAEVRQELHEREKEVHQQFTRFDEERNFGKQVKQVVAPYESFIKSLGADPVQAFDYLIRTDYNLRTAPPEQRKAMFLQAAKDYGIDFNGTIPGIDEPANAMPTHDPRYETLQERINRLESERNADILAAQERERQTLDQQIESFASDPAHAHFDRLRPMMAVLLQNGQAENLDKAYEMALFADPETRALHLAATREAEERKRTAAAQAKADAARNASVSVTGAPGLAVPAPMESSGSIEDDIRSAIRLVSDRV